jgi:hypothetical protein
VTRQLVVVLLLKHINVGNLMMTLFTPALYPGLPHAFIPATLATCHAAAGSGNAC